MTKLIYITLIDAKKEVGVFNKINAQCISFSKKYSEVDIIYYKGNEVFINDISLGFEKKQNKVIRKIGSKIFFSKKIKTVCVNSDYNTYYIRAPYISLGFIKFLKEIRNRNSNANIIIELPTYPYKNEIKRLISKLLYKAECVMTKYISKYVDFITYYGIADDYIWNLPAIKLENGIDINTIAIVKRENITNQLNFIAVANLSDWHGYDRFIRSMANVDSELLKNIIFNIVGEGGALKQLKELTEKLKLNNNIFFHGIKTGDELDQLFNISNIGVGSLGMYRAGLSTGSTLKAREFTARGIPFLLGYDDYSFSNEIKFIKKIKNDNSLFDISSIKDWYEHENFDENKIREYAIKNLSWDKEIEKVTKKIRL